MLFLVLLTIFGQNLTGSAYVVLRNNYYFPWQHQPVRGLPLVYSPVQYPFYNWMYYYTKQENLELKNLKERQTTTFNLLKCLIEEEKKDVCKTMLNNAKTLFESPAMSEANNVVIKMKPSRVVTVSANQKGYEAPPTTIAQLYPPATENIQIQNKNQEDEVSTTNKEEITAPLSITPKIVNANFNQSMLEENVEPTNKAEESLPTVVQGLEVKTREMPSDESLIKDARPPSDSDVLIQTPGEVLSNTSDSVLDKTEETATSGNIEKEQPTTIEKVK